MGSEIMRQILQTIEAEVASRYTPIEFEMAYQARIAMDCIRFAIKHIEQFGPHTDQIREVGLQLLDALQRLELADRRFQVKSRVGLGTEIGKPNSAHESLDGGEVRSDETNRRRSNAAASH
jgi:hypothetical protein